MTRTRLSLFYLAGYLTFAGLALVILTGTTYLQERRTDA